MMRLCTKFRDLLTTDKRIAIWGAGKRTQWIYDCLHESGMFEKVSCIIDNNTALQESRFEYKTFSCPIYSLETCLTKSPALSILVGIKFNWDEVFYQVKKYSNADIDLYFYSQLDFEPFPYSFPKMIVGKPQIPKIIHYCWFGNKELPSRLKANVDGWKRLLPDWEIIRWDESNYDINKNEYLRQAQNLLENSWMKAANYARYDVVYNYGGIYLDTDVELLRSIDSWRYNEAFFVFEEWSMINGGNGFGAIKGHPIIKDMMDTYLNKLHFGTCVSIETPLLKKYGLICNNTLQNISGVQIYPSDTVKFYHYTYKLPLSENSFAKHVCSNCAGHAKINDPLYEKLLQDMNEITKE